MIVGVALGVGVDVLVGLAEGCAEGVGVRSGVGAMVIMAATVGDGVGVGGVDVTRGVAVATILIVSVLVTVLPRSLVARIVTVLIPGAALAGTCQVSVLVIREVGSAEALCQITAMSMIAPMTKAIGIPRYITFLLYRNDLYVGSVSADLHRPLPRTMLK